MRQLGDAIKQNDSTRIEIGDAINQLELIAGQDWLHIANSGTYISASSFSLVGDFSSYLAKGTKLKFTNSGTKYAHVVSAVFGGVNTVVTIAVNTSYTIANAGISNVYASERCPIDFPSLFSLSSSNVVGFSVLPTSVVVSYYVHNKVCTMIMRCAGYGTSNSTSFYCNTPFSSNGSFDNIILPASYCYDNGSNKLNAVSVMNAGASRIDLFPDHSGSGWTASGNKTGCIGSLPFPL